jgi:hypothetical protein
MPLLDAARIGRQTANSSEAQLKRATTQRKNALAQHSWKTVRPAHMADRRVLFPKSPADSRHDVSFSYRAPNLSLALVRWTDPRGLSATPEALGGSGATRRRFAGWSDLDVERCDSCGQRAISYNSCLNRHCPKCQAAARQTWLGETFCRTAARTLLSRRLHPARRPMFSGRGEEFR